MKIFSFVLRSFNLNYMNVTMVMKTTYIYIYELQVHHIL